MYRHIKYVFDVPASSRVRRGCVSPCKFVQPAQNRRRNKKHILVSVEVGLKVLCSYKQPLWLNSLCSGT